MNVGPTKSAHELAQESSVLMRPHAITISKTALDGETFSPTERTSAGISFLGGVALFNPENELLYASERRLIALNLVGFTSKEIAHELGQGEKIITKKIKFLSELILIDFEHDDALDQCLDPIKPLLILTKSADLGLLPIALTELEATVMQGVALGLDDNEMAKSNDKPINTITSSEARIAKKLGSRRSRVTALAGTLAGLTGKSPLLYPNVGEVVDHYKQRPVGSLSVRITPDFIPYDREEYIRSGA